MPIPSYRRSRAYLLWGLGILAVTLACFVGYDLNWIHQRNLARDWLEGLRWSWYSPSLVGAKIQASPPCCLALFGEEGMVAIGLDDMEFGGPVPYGREQLMRLFPEARVDRSVKGRFFDNQQDDGHLNIWPPPESGQRSH